MSSDEDEYESGLEEHHNELSSQEDHGDSVQESDARTSDHSQYGDDNDINFINNTADEGRDLSSLLDAAVGHQDSVDVRTSLQKRMFLHENKQMAVKKRKLDAALKSIKQDRTKRHQGKSLLEHTSTLMSQEQDPGLNYALEITSNRNDAEQGQRRGPIKTAEDERDYSAYKTSEEQSGKKSPELRKKLKRDASWESPGPDRRKRL